MKRVSLLAVMMFLFASVVTAQVADTNAPEQTQDTNTVETATNTVESEGNTVETATNTVESEGNAIEVTNNAIESDQQATESQEKEVVAAEGVVYNDGNFDYASPDVKYVINARDEGAGVKAIYVQLDDSAMGLYTEAISVRSEGKHLIAYKVKDQVENVSPVKNYEFWVDATAPIVRLKSIQKPVKIGDVLYVSSNYRFALSASDELSGVKSIEVAQDNADFQVYESNLAPVSGEGGLHKVLYQATDNVGNVSDKKEFQYFLDLKAPSIEITSDPAVFEKDGKNYISPLTAVKVSAKDEESGVEKIWVAIDEGDYSEYQFPIHFTAGTHTLKVKAIDAVGNESAEKTMEFEVDGDSPEADIVPNK